MAGEPVQRRLQFVLQHFDKRPTENVILNYFGLANEVYTITTADGKFVVKNCFKNNTKELVANEAALIQTLNTEGVPCPTLVPTKKGEPYLLYDGQHYIMSKFMAGYTPTWDESLTETLVSETMRAMAEFHKVTEYFQPPFDSGRMTALDLPGIKQWLADLKTELETDTSRRQSVMQMRIITDKLMALAYSLADELESIDLSVLKQVYIHGDLHCYNLIFSEDRQRYLGIVDFDFIRKDFRLVDFLWASRSILWSYFYPKVLGYKPKKSSQQPTRLQSQALMAETLEFMILAYRKHHDLPDDEIKLLPLFAKALPLFTVRFFKLTNSEDECLSHADWFGHQVAHLDETVADIEFELDSFFNR